MEEHRSTADGPAFAELVRLLGRDGTIDPRDEHERWAVYQAALARGDLLGPLLAATVAEPEPALAVGVAFAMLERLPAGEAEPWVRAVPEPEREKVRTRATDLAVLHGRTPADAAAAEREVAAWSDWLQWRLAAESHSAAVLTLLEAHGRTRRVRGLARERLVRERLVRSRRDG
ncbi:hypothetical protein [Cellulomonas cellasea]|uniref:Uncharacterized protein n=1 Tax=Cellulomonas cellasea TaxID=43670 RepID=A0A7W4YDN5_9CELL|nr:hypothetical protein [Cellulomonas cellasea]MBB2924862.1 hypothetical protein [Cellulomonas cellasea]